MVGATRELEVVVVGAGFSGIGAGIRLREAGIEAFEILERAEDVGGTWREATYPGVAVDIPSFTYSFSFEPNPDWSRVYATGDELRAYAERCADKYALRPHLRFGRHVTDARFEPESDRWIVRTADGEIRRARFLINATGGLSRPKIPELDGLASFDGPVVHTARWDHDQDLRGLRVGIIGTGASAVQVLPALAPDAAHTSVFQRTPIWVLPRLDRRISDAERALFRRWPVTQRALRLLTSSLSELVMVLGVVYHRQTPSVIRAIERLSRAHLRAQVPDPALRAALTPGYGFGCKRPAFSNDYWRAFTRDDVDLVTAPIREVTPRGVRTEDGVEHPLDALVLATGYRIWEPGNFPPYPVHGLDDEELGSLWRRERYSAYRGATVPSFPNFFLVLGPYAASGSSWFSMIEVQTRHALRCIVEARRRGVSRVEIRRAAHDAQLAEVLRRQRDTVFFNNRCATANSYYFDPHGDAPFLRPASGVEADLASRFFPMSDYRFSARPSARSREETHARI